MNIPFLDSIHFTNQEPILHLLIEIHFAFYTQSAVRQSICFNSVRLRNLLKRPGKQDLVYFVFDKLSLADLTILRLRLADYVFLEKK